MLKVDQKVSEKMKILSKTLWIDVFRELEDNLN